MQAYNRVFFIWHRRSFLTVLIRLYTHGIYNAWPLSQTQQASILTQVKQLRANCSAPVPGHDSELVAKHVLSTAPAVGFTKAERFMTKSSNYCFYLYTPTPVKMNVSNTIRTFALRSADPRSYLAHHSRAPASSRVFVSTHTHIHACVDASIPQNSQLHAALTKHASPACASFFSTSTSWRKTTILWFPREAWLHESWLQIRRVRGFNFYTQQRWAARGLCEVDGCSLRQWPNPETKLIAVKKNPEIGVHVWNQALIALFQIRFVEPFKDWKGESVRNRVWPRKKKEFASVWHYCPCPLQSLWHVR